MFLFQALIQTILGHLSLPGETMTVSVAEASDHSVKEAPCACTNGFYARHHGLLYGNLANSSRCQYVTVHVHSKDSKSESASK